MISDSDYQELREVMFDFKRQYPDMGDFLLVYNSLKDTPILKKLNDTITVGEIGDAFNKIDCEYRAITLAALDLSEALSYIRSRSPMDWNITKARDLGRAALAKAGIVIPEPMNQESYYYYVISNRHIESGWEYESDAIDRSVELQEAGVENTIVLKDNLIIDPWGNNNWSKT